MAFLPPRILTRYYLATPLFAVADLALGWPIRVAGLVDPLHRAMYYAGLVGLGFLCRARPASEPWVGIGESAVNILLLILAVMLPIWSLPEAFESGAPLEGPFSRVSLGNFVLSGTVLVVSFHRNQNAALRSRPAPPGSSAAPR